MHMKPKLIFSLLSLLLVSCLSLSAQENTTGSKAGKMPVADRTKPLKVGEIAPDFTLSDLNGKQVMLSKAKMPVVLVFYRGYW